MKFYVLLVIGLILVGCQRELTVALSCEDSEYESMPEEYKDDHPLVFIPTAFTPNRDGLNDLLRPIINYKHEVLNVCIKRNWREIYSSNDVSEWNGENDEGELCPAGVYKYEFEILDENENKITLSGKISLGEEGADLSCDCRLEDMIDPSQGFVRASSESCTSL